jgi:hypothetical protein
LTAPELTEKLVELNEATPVVEVVALAADTAPAAEIEMGATPETANVPEALGIVIVLAADGAVKLKVVELAPDVPNTSDVPT